jgi:GNAT superfamily N-acetyltransferase
MFALQRTTGSDPRLQPLIAELDADLRSRYGATQALYAPHNHVKDDAPFVIVVDEVGTPIACGSFRPFDATSVEIKRMFVAPAARRRGVARALIGELEAWARDRGFATALLETGDRQTEAIALYEHCGYARTEAFGPYVGLPVSVCMRKTL